MSLDVSVSSCATAMRLHDSNAEHGNTCPESLPFFGNGITKCTNCSQKVRGRLCALDTVLSVTGGKADQRGLDALPVAGRASARQRRKQSNETKP
eukprot:6167754-Amphidinium_carterae.1